MINQSIGAGIVRVKCEEKDDVHEILFKLYEGECFITVKGTDFIPWRDFIFEIFREHTNDNLSVGFGLYTEWMEKFVKKYINPLPEFMEREFIRQGKLQWSITQKIRDKMRQSINAAIWNVNGKEICYKCKEVPDVKMLVCGKCKVVSYCSQECCSSDWNEHKKVCSEWKDRKQKLKEHIKAKSEAKKCMEKSKQAEAEATANELLDEAETEAKKPKKEKKPETEKERKARETREANKAKEAQAKARKEFYERAGMAVSKKPTSKKSKK